MTLKLLGLTLSALAAAAIIYRILWLMANRVPVLAHSTNTDALGQTRLDDPLNPHGGRHGVLNESDMHLAYQVNGQAFENDQVKHSIDGLAITAPDDQPILWVDPANPAAVATTGPGFWVVMLLLVGALAALFLQLP